MAKSKQITVKRGKKIDGSKQNFMADFEEYARKNGKLSENDVRTGKNKTFKIEDIFILNIKLFLYQAKSINNFFEEAGCAVKKYLLSSIGKIPSQTQFRFILDGINYINLSYLFHYIIRLLKTAGKLKRYLFKSEYLLVALDGTQANISTKISCDQCSNRKPKDKDKQFYHYVVGICIVGLASLGLLPINLPPEILTQQDGNVKQDCERRAGLRLVERVKDFLNTLGYKIIFLGDDIYCYETFCQYILSINHSFILTCKPGSHKYLYETIDWKKIKTIKKRKRLNKKYFCIQIFQYEKNVPIKEDTHYTKKTSYGKNILHVHFIMLTETKYDNNGQPRRNGKGEIIKKVFSFATNIEPNENNIEDLIAAGRSRWEIENRNFNILKNHGYNLSHNFGHGKKGLCNFFITTVIFAFLFHVALRLLYPKLDAYIKKHTNICIFRKFYDFITMLNELTFFKTMDDTGLSSSNVAADFESGKLHEKPG